MAAWVAPAVSVAWVPWEALRLPTSPVVPVVSVAQAEQVVWPLPVEPVDPTGLAGQGMRVAQLPRVSCQRAVALALPEPVVPWHLAEPSAAVELQAVPAQLALPVQPVAVGHEAVGVPRVPSHLEQPAELGHSEPLEHLALLERSELQGRWVLLERWVPKKHPGPWEPQVAWECLAGLARWVRKGNSVQKVEWAPPEH